jgi:hypothetical protein
MYNRDPAAMINLLSHGFEPDLILLGNFNGAGSNFTTAIRKSRYAANFPSASIVEMPITFKSSVPEEKVFIYLLSQVRWSPTFKILPTIHTKFPLKYTLPLPLCAVSNDQFTTPN